MNPFEPPREISDAAPRTKSKRKRAPRRPKLDTEPVLELFTPGQIALATAAGWPMAAAWLIAWNYRTLGNRSASPIALAGGVVGMFLSFWFLSLFSPEMLALGLFGAPLVLGFIAHVLQGADIARSLGEGARTRPWSLALGIGLLFFVALTPFILVYQAAFGRIYRPEPTESALPRCEQRLSPST